MIIFDGVDIQSVAKVQIVDVHVSPISYEVAARPNAIAPGSSFIRNRCGTRSVVITFALKEEEMNSRQNFLMAINEWAKSDKEYKLEIPGCVWNATPRSLSPLERNIGFWTQA